MSEFGNDAVIWICRRAGDYFPHPECPFDCDCEPVRYIRAATNQTQAEANAEAPKLEASKHVDHPADSGGSSSPEASSGAENPGATNPENGSGSSPVGDSDLIEQVARAIAGETFGLGTVDRMFSVDSPLGVLRDAYLEQAAAVVPLVRADRDREIREHLLGRDGLKLLAETFERQGFISLREDQALMLEDALHGAIDFALACIGTEGE